MLFRSFITEDGKEGTWDFKKIGAGNEGIEHLISVNYEAYKSYDGETIKYC